MGLGLATPADLGSGVSPRQHMRERVEEIEPADELGLDVFGIGERRRPDFPVFSPAVLLGADAVRTERADGAQRYLTSRPSSAIRTWTWGPV
jgi:alkanesulfonate monooxygenase SsuD/methylene tetrahydromethanopterin reductase-like flavin-dependent oxidoreductase (luciferase family)